MILSLGSMEDILKPVFRKLLSRQTNLNFLLVITLATITVCLNDSLNRFGTKDVSRNYQFSRLLSLGLWIQWHITWHVMLLVQPRPCYIPHVPRPMLFCISCLYIYNVRTTLVWRNKLKTKPAWFFVLHDVTNDQNKVILCLHFWWTWQNCFESEGLYKLKNETAHTCIIFIASH